MRDDKRVNEGFRAALERLLADERRTSLRGALTVVLCAALAAFSMLIMAGAALRGWRFFPLFSFVFFWAAVAAATAAASFKQFVPARTERRLANRLDHRFGGGNLIAAALEFSNEGERTRAYSPYLLGATVSRAAARLGGIDSRALFAEAGRPGWLAAGILAGALVAAQISLLGGDAGSIVGYLADPDRSFRSAHAYNLVVVSGDRFVLPGEDVSLEALNFGGSRGAASLFVSAVPGVWKKIDVKGETALEGGMALTVYRHAVKDVREDFAYAFSAGGARTGDYRVRVIHRPVVNRLRAVVKPPAYTRASPDTIEPLAGKIAALGGARVELEGETSAPVREGWIRFLSGRRVPLEPGGAGVRGAFTVAADDTFVVEVVDSLGFANDHAVKYAVAMLEDRAPGVEILAPEDGAQLPRTLEAEIFYRAADDYGLARAELHYMRDGKDEAFREVPLVLPAARPLVEIDGRVPWSLADENVFPGDKILYYLQVTDNNTATGPASARTETRRLLVPSISEIYARISEDGERRREDLEGLLDKGREIRARIKNLSDELKAEGDLDWSRRRESGEILEKQRELGDTMREIAGQIDRSLETMEKNRAASQEVGEKVEEIRKLLERIENEDLRRAIENLQNLMSEMSSKDLVPAMEEIEMDADKLLENMDRTIELLKRVIAEEKMDELVRRMDEMLEEQTALRDSTPRGDTDELSKRQSELGKEAENYEDRLSKFAEEQESDSSLAAELEKALEEMERSKLNEQMDRAADELSGGERDDAQRTQQSAIDEMLNLYTRMSSCQMSMGLAMDREVSEMLARSTRELVETSKLQEKIIPKVAGAGRAAPEDLVREELVVKTAVDKIARSLSETARRTMVLSPAVFASLGAAQREINAALSAMEEERMADAAEASARSYRRLNLAAVELLRANVSSGGSSSGARQRMQQLMQRQMSLQQELQRLLERGRAGQWSTEERAHMARLAGEQRKMKELVEQIGAESQGTNELMGKLDDIAGAMEQIAKDLEEGRLDRDIIDRQERIFTRLLDSQRSMRERDYKKERTSTTAGAVAPLAPGTREGRSDDREVLLRTIRRAMQEKGPAEYEDLLRLYFRALSEKAREGQ